MSLEIARWLEDRVVKVLRQFPLGLTRDEIRARLGYKSVSSVNGVIRELLADGTVRAVPEFPAGNVAQKIKLTRREE